VQRAAEHPSCFRQHRTLRPHGPSQPRRRHESSECPRTVPDLGPKVEPCPPVQRAAEHPSCFRQHRTLRPHGPSQPRRLHESSERPRTVPDLGPKVEPCRQCSGRLNTHPAFASTARFARTAQVNLVVFMTPRMIPDPDPDLDFDFDFDPMRSAQWSRATSVAAWLPPRATTRPYSPITPGTRPSGP
jgi:hypothetical protein